MNTDKKYFLYIWNDNEEGGYSVWFTDRYEADFQNCAVCVTVVGCFNTPEELKAILLKDDPDWFSGELADKQVSIFMKFLDEQM